MVGRDVDASKGLSHLAEPDELPNAGKEIDPGGVTCGTDEDLVVAQPEVVLQRRRASGELVLLNPAPESRCV